MKILILGGTGAMGVFLVKQLKSLNHQVVVTSRRDKISYKNITYVKGDAKDVSFVKELLGNNWDVIVDFMVYSSLEFNERISLFLDSTAQYVYLSSARVFNNSKTPLTETSLRLLDSLEDKEFLSTDEYSLIKAKQEDVLKTSESNNWTIIRPYITYSENRFQLGVLEKEEWLYRVLKGRAIVFSKELCDKLTTMTHGLDVSKGILAILGNKKALGETYNITTGTSYSWGEVLNIYLEILEEKLGYLPKVYLLESNKFIELVKNNYQVKYDRCYDRRFDNSKITKLLGDHNYIELKEGLRSCLELFLKKPEFLSINWRLEALKDKFSNEHTSLKEIKGIKPKLSYILNRYIK
ncbi:NAD-dependent epimerase/dehydratase family protein [Aestuariibaculum sediminum]|uniref:NAD-dependent epimerase/dehydratase family protein n=1 Tax=Aestuariibaculum sediminum TaxID=2770637 RepID=A0A8J6Q6X7_9FLAO|nr:NAD-dependent epimerase/dehydratase family protein [Aestuariibaculum sediminum]MBD0831215.1 NAD-dependent epimerase/dehydratase family protein [Aestuariibaculum sediminum]